MNAHILDEDGFFLSWATLKLVVRLCFTLFLSLLLTISLSLSLSRMQPHSSMIQPFHWWYIFMMMSWCSILCFFETNIFHYQYSVCAAPIPIFGSIYRRLKCKMLPIDFFSIIYLFNSIFIHFKYNVIHIIMYIEFELQRNIFDRRWKRKRSNHDDDDENLIT